MTTILLRSPVLLLLLLLLLFIYLFIYSFNNIFYFPSLITLHWVFNQDLAWDKLAITCILCIHVFAASFGWYFSVTLILLSYGDEQFHKMQDFVFHIGQGLPGILVMCLFVPFLIIPSAPTNTATVVVFKCLIFSIYFYSLSVFPIPYYYYYYYYYHHYYYYFIFIFSFDFLRSFTESWTKTLGDNTFQKRLVVLQSAIFSISCRLGLPGILLMYLSAHFLIIPSSLTITEEKFLFYCL